MMEIIPKRLPAWFKQRIAPGAELDRVLSVLDGYRLNTVCESASCPNRGYCYSKGTATFMILGNTCTRDCRFCAVGKGKPQPVDDEEPERIGLAVRELGLKYIVVTSVTRDDLPDGGAGQFAETVRQLKAAEPEITVELLIPDFQGKEDTFRTVMDACPDVVGHNLETIPWLYPSVRPQAVYKRSIESLRYVKSLNSGVLTKSGLMLGLGETNGEVESAFADLSDTGCDILTLGQYLQPSPGHLPVAEYVTPQEFEEYRTTALACGFRAVSSGPLVRSSYDAEELYREASGK
jgi:lipoic acid synthetase